MYKLTQLAAGLLTSAFVFDKSAAFAEEADVVLDTELAARSLHTETVDMVAFYLETNAGMELTVTYIVRNKAEEPQRMQMLLNDGDVITCALPCLPQTQYTFARSGDKITIDAAPVKRPLLRKML